MSENKKTSEQTVDPKGRDRSPNYPSIGFRTAVELTRKIFDEEKRHPMSRELATKRMGYGGINGRSRMVLSALRKHGLLEALPHDQVRVSDEAYALLITPKDDPSRVQLLRSLALRPSIYKELLEEYSTDLPSDANLRTNLILRRKFTEAAADSFIEALKETLTELREAGALENPSPGTGTDGKKEDNGPGQPLSLFPPSLAKPGTDPGLKTPQALDVQIINLGDGIKAELRILGPAQPKHIRKLVRFLNLTLEDTDESPTPEEPSR